MGFSIKTHSGSPACTPGNAYPRRAAAMSGLRLYCPETGRWLSRDPIGERGRAYLNESYSANYSFVNNHPIGYVDPSGLRIFFSKSAIHAADGKKTGTIILYNLLRYTAGPCCKELWGQENVKAKLDETAKNHAQMLEDFINKGKNVTYNDGTVVWSIRLKVIITTEPAYSVEEHLAALNKVVDILSEEWYEESAKHRVYGQDNAYSDVMVFCKQRDVCNMREIPALGPEWKNRSYPGVLAHELIGHYLNNYDEVNKGDERSADILRKRLGREIEDDAIMTYKKGAETFYDRNFAAGIEDINNITGEKDLIADHTSLLDVSDPWFSRYEDKRVAELSLEKVKAIVGVK